MVLLGLYLLLSRLSHGFIYGQGHLERPIFPVVASPKYSSGGKGRRSTLSLLIA